MALPEHREKMASIKVEVISDENRKNAIHFQIEDPGEGFNHKKYKTIDEDRLFDNHGRGIAVGATLAFDKLLYNDKGNIVTAIVKF